MHSKLAKRVLGAMVSAAVMVSMIPAMALAEGEEIKAVTFSVSSTVHSGGTATADGIVLSPVGGQVGNNFLGVDEYDEAEDPNPEDNIVGKGTFTFSIDPTGAYANGKIVGVDIVIPADPSWGRSINNIALESGEGWEGFAANSTFSWSGKAESTSFTMVATEGDSHYHYFSYSSITVYVVVPVNSITISAGEGVPAYLYKGDTGYELTATVLPDNTTYDIDDLVWSTQNTDIITLTPSNDSSTVATVTGLACGTATVTAKLGGVEGTYNIAVYDHVSGATINQTSAEIYTGNTLPLTAAPTNANDVRADDYTITWDSTDEEVATVNNGVVTAVATGEAKIIATITDNGVSPATEYTATCYVTVSEAPVGTVSMHRLYNPNSGEHFFTSDEAEYEGLVAIGWHDEGIGWIAPASSDTPVYRLYNQNGGEHHYTMSTSERDSLVEAGWRYEGIGWYSADSTQLPVYRQYNPNAFANNHNYTANVTERDDLISLGWHDEQIAWYGILPQAPV